MPVGDYSELDEFRGDLPEPTTAPTPASPFIPKSIIDAAGDLIVGTADNTPDRLGAGAEGDVLAIVSGVPGWSATAGGGGGGGPALPAALDLDATPREVIRATNLNAHVGWTHGASFAFNGWHYRFCSNIVNSVWRTRSPDGEAWEDTVLVYHSTDAVVNHWMSSVGVQSKTLTIASIGTDDVVHCTAHGLTAGQIVKFLALTGGGSGLLPDTDYYVRDVTTDSFKVESTVGGGAVNVTVAYTASTGISAYFWGVLDVHHGTLNNDTHQYASQSIMRSIDNGLTWSVWQAMPNGTGLAPCIGTPDANAAEVPSVFSGLVQVGADMMGALWGRDGNLRAGFVTWTHLSDADGTSSTIVSHAITGANGERAPDNQVWSDGAGTIVIPLRFDTGQGTACKITISSDSGVTWNTTVLDTPARVDGSSMAIGVTPDGLQFVLAAFYRYENTSIGEGDIFLWSGNKAYVLAHPTNPSSGIGFGNAAPVGYIFGRSQSVFSTTGPNGQGGFSTDGSRMVLSFGAPTDIPDRTSESDVYTLAFDFASDRIESPVVTRSDVWNARPSDTLFLPQTTKTVGTVWQRNVRFLHSYGADYNVFLGYGSGNFTCDTAAGNVGVGALTFENATTAQENVAIGLGALNHVTIGLNHTAVGAAALAVVSASNGLTAVGYAALNSATGNLTTAVGIRAGESASTGGSCLFLGGFAAYATVMTGDSNSYIGASTLASGAAVSHETVLGADATGSGSNTITLGRQDGSDSVNMRGELRLQEVLANGSNYTGFKAPASLAGNPVYEMPAAFPASDKVLQSSNAGVLTWVAGGSGALTIDTTTVSTMNDAILVNNSGTLSEVVMTVPSLKTWFATPTSAALANAMTDEVGVGSGTPLLVFNAAPNFYTYVGTGVSILGAHTTETGTAAEFSVIGNSLTTGTGVYLASSSLTTGLLLDLLVTGTTTTGGQTQRAGQIALTGAHSNSGVTSKGLVISNTQTGTSSTNICLDLTASGAATNTALNVTAGGTTLQATTATSLALGGATIGTNAFAATGTGFISGTFTFGDGSGATAILASNLSGATDPTITFGNALVTVSNGLTVTGVTAINGAGAASTPSLNVSGVPFAGTGTTSFPLVYINDANATASTTLNTAGTYLGVNGDGTQDLINLLKDGASQFKVSSAGVTTIVGNVLGAPNYTCGGGAFEVYGSAANAITRTVSDRRFAMGFAGANGVMMNSDYMVGFSSNASGADGGTSVDTRISRQGAGVLQVGTTANNALGSVLLVGLTATGKIASTGTSPTALVTGNTTFAVTSNLATITGTNAVTIATITGGVSGMVVQLLFVDANVTITDTAANTADTVNLSAAFTSAANTVLTLVHNGTKWFEVSRSVN